MRSSHRILCLLAAAALAGVLAGCSSPEPEPVDPNAGAVPNTPAASADIVAAIANARVAVVTYMVGSPGKVVPQLAELADYGYDNSLTNATLTVFSQELSLDAKYCLEATRAGYVYKAVGNTGDIIPGTCQLDTDY